MAKLILTLDGVVLKEYALTKERTTIGRKAHNDVQIDNLAISGEHAAIVTILNDSFLEDLGSTNGTLVNGQPIKKHFLQNGDSVEIGKYKIKYVSDQANAATAADFEKTMVLRPPKASDARTGDVQSATRTDIRRMAGDAASQASAVTTSHPIPSTMQTHPGVTPPRLPVAPPPSASAAASGSAPSQGMIQILSGPNAGRELPLVKALTTLGKPGVEVAVIAKRPQGYFLTHVEGIKFPIVNGKSLDSQARLLSDHDIVELAGVKMEFFFKPPA